MKAPRGNQAPKIKAANPEQELGSPAPQEEGKVLGRSWTLAWLIHLQCQ